MNERTRGAALIIMAGAIWLAMEAALPAQQAEVRIENGVRVVRNPATPVKGAAVDAFDPEGFYVARFFVPEGEETVTVRNDELYVFVKESAAGNPLVKRYALKWD